MIFLTVPELIRIATRVLDGDVTVRDHGLLESATARTRATAFGTGAYETVEEKAAALLQSLVRTTQRTNSSSESRRVSWTRLPASPTASDEDATPATFEDMTRGLSPLARSPAHQADGVR